MSQKDALFKQAEKAAKTAAEEHNKAKNIAAASKEDQDSALAIAAIASVSGDGTEKMELSIDQALSNSTKKAVLSDAHQDVAERTIKEAKLKKQLAVSISVMEELQEEAEINPGGVTEKLAEMSENLVNAQEVQVDSARTDRNMAENIANILETTADDDND